MVDGKNVYKAKDLDEFQEKITKILDGTLPDLTEEAYKVALEKDIKNVSKELKKVYEEVTLN